MGYRSHSQNPRPPPSVRRVEPGKVAGVSLAVFGTFLAGLWLCFLRYRSGSILAPVIAHISSNSVGFVMAWIVVT